MKTTAITATAIAIVLAAAPARAQGPWSLEFQGNGAHATSQLAGGDLGTGFGFGAAIGYHLYAHMSAYAGWDWARFGTPDAFAPGDVELEETGYVLGLRWEHPLGSREEGAHTLWLRAGGSYKHLEVEDDTGDIIADSGHGLGWEMGAGVGIPVGASWRLTPGIRYQALTRDLEVGSGSTEVELNHLTFEIGGRWYF